ncbi:MAG: MiaB/RimO family radical SAM methylthiotransferase [Humidesulfovibrio sp.]|nr:MiaB/RimO family radical SAM methylthiotransferase [Humidesulfovibrio sp.]
MQKFHVVTLGCKINQYESEAVIEAWRALGLLEVAAPEAAQVLLVNSCAVTSRAVRDLRAQLRRLRRANPGARLVVTGCAAQVLQGELAAMPEVDEVVPQDRKAVLLSGPSGPFGSSDSFGPSESYKGVAPLSAVVPRPFPPFSIGAFNRARAVVKVQDGCSHGCTYCIVPLTRGPSLSREPGETLAEMRRLLDAGYRELVLSGVNLRQYGRDLAEPLDFWDLLARIEAELAPDWAGRARLRLSSVEPGQLDAKALDVLGASRLVAPHLHLSLQSGDPEVLRRMGRGHYRPEQVLEFLAGLRRAWPRLGLGADLLTGFPGETEAQFEKSLAFCRSLPLTYAHVFPYSSRPGTPAASWPDTLLKAERTARAARLRALSESRKRAFLKVLAAQPQLTVLVEKATCKSGGGEGLGVCEFYAPCLLRGEALLRESLVRGSLVRMRPEGVEAGRIVGAALKPEGA